MAQAARLNLRMQKELKLLLSDPPHGASFPLLSDAESSLSSIHALIEGPEGTVYANGVFHIKIQIPERYPFQPPSVTFATPIYHPNIDTGGRICLDILNLPPKGAWQPSLNISTVLTSIGLLLSDPNPDDGLMCEASKEYKYDRQTFDQKARSMTEKYAKAGASVNIGCSESNLIGSRPSMMETEQPDKEPKCEVTGTSREKKSLGVSRKLSLDSSRLSQEMNCDVKLSEVATHTVNLFNCDNQMEIKGRKNDSDDEVDGYNYEKLSGTRRKLSLDCSSKFKKRNSDFQDNSFPDTYQSALKPQTYNMECSESSSISESGNHKHTKPIKKSLSLGSKKLCQVEQKQPLEFSNISQITDSDKPKHHALKLLAEPEPIARSTDVITNNNSGKLSIIGKKLSLGSKRPLHIEGQDNKENVIPMHISYRLLPHDGESYVKKNANYGKNTSNVNGSRQKLSSQYSQEQDEKIVGAVMEQESEESHIDDEAVIVLDSEDSEEEINEDFWPKLSIGRKRLARKWRAKA